MPAQRAMIAVVCNTGLGDGLLFERLAHALEQAGQPCAVYSDFLLQLAPVYPNRCLRPYPCDIESEASSFWQAHKEYLFQQYAPGSHLQPAGRVIQILGESCRLPGQSWADYLRSFLHQRALPGWLSSSIQPLASWSYRRHRRRVLIHPGSLKREKNWPASKFIQLALSLRQQGWSVEFCATKVERAIFEPLLEQAGLPPLLLLELLELAHYLYESGYFIGNDSGISHLASALAIPTLKIFDRASRARFWSGGWPLSCEVLPWPLPTRAWRRRGWKRLLSVKRVERAFARLTQLY